MSVRIWPELEGLLVPLDDVHQHQSNPNNGDLEIIRESILLNGFYSPIIIDASGTILAGNHRYQVMCELGATHIPAVRIDPDSTVGKRILLVDNESTRKGWDDPALRLQLLRDISEEGLPTGIAGTGYSEDEWVQMLRDSEPPLSFFGNSTKVTISVTCEHMDSARDLSAELMDRGFEVTGVTV